jgi:hypothetical protein
MSAVEQGMMTMPKMHYARASAAAIAASLALSPIYAAPPKPIVDLSQSPALSEEKAPPPAAKTNSGPIDEQTMELGGGALALLVIGGAALAISARRRRRERESWEFESQAAEAPMAEAAPEARPLADESAMVQPPMSSFDWNKEPRRESADGDCEELESWVDRAKCGPTPDNPSQSLKKRMKRAAFFEKRDREVAAGEAAPIDPDAGLPENLEETA